MGAETVNDLDGLVANFWRGVQSDPEKVAHYADWPVNENDMHARHAWLVGQKDSLQSRLEGDPDYFDAKIAGWWVWGLCAWIGSEYCSGKGPWQVQEIDGVRQLVHLGDQGQGIHRKRVHLHRHGRGIHRNSADDLVAYLGEIADRLRRVRVCCGDWSRVCGPTPTVKQGLTGVFLDPPYADTAGREKNLYRQDSLTVAHAVRAWAIAHGDDPLFRIALCGYEGEHAMPDSWECVPWKARGGYGTQSKSGKGRDNARRERIWFSPHCLRPDSEDASLFPSSTPED